MRTKLAGIAIVLTAAAAMAAGQGDARGPKDKEAIVAAEKWLALVDAGRYGESWEAAARLFKGAVDRETWSRQVGAARGPLGALKSRRVKSTEYRTTVPGGPDGEYVVITFEASYAKKASAIETVTPMKDPDGAWRVSGYYIR
jgi:hypothetical protein